MVCGARLVAQWCEVETQGNRLSWILPPPFSSFFFFSPFFVPIRPPPLPSLQLGLIFLIYSVRFICLVKLDFRFVLDLVLFWRLIWLRLIRIFRICVIEIWLRFVNILEDLIQCDYVFFVWDFVICVWFVDVIGLD